MKAERSTRPTHSSRIPPSESPSWRPGQGAQGRHFGLTSRGEVLPCPGQAPPWAPSSTNPPWLTMGRLRDGAQCQSWHHIRAMRAEPQASAPYQSCAQASSSATGIK